MVTGALTNWKSYGIIMLQTKMARLSHLSICQKHIIHTTKYYLKKCTHFGESRYIASTQKLSDSILSDIYFCGVLNVAAFYFSSNLIKTLFSLSIT